MFRLLVSDKSGRILDIPEIDAAGMKAGCFFKPDREEFIKIPPGSRLFMLPGRMPVGYDTKTGEIKTLENYFAVAAFIAPGFTGTYSAAYTRLSLPYNDILPLYCYTAAGFYKGDIYVAAVKVDRSSRHAPGFIDIGLVRKNTVKIKKIFPWNRLISHLADCALVHGCPGAQNFFLSREECPLPISPDCNANCAGCISYQKQRRGQACLSPTQPRIKFTPSPEEVAETALFYIHNLKKAAGGGRDRPLLSFGQGCEGEPLLQADLIEKSIRLIRKATSQGIININTNASKPEAISRLFDIGLDSIRVSMNSVRKEYYERYYKPRGYDFQDVLSSIKIAKKKKGFVSVNYLTMPGFTDSKGEFKAFEKFLETYKIDMIQWRNLNFDPLEYFRVVRSHPEFSDIIGIRQIIKSIKKSFPYIKMGYYNPRRI
ncbi:MAG: radical SAM protein [Candidatus Omnitrophota bacterium]|nr:radical SAM protein [Candidatus Omnitrophota bacterium]